MRLRLVHAAAVLMMVLPACRRAAPPPSPTVVAKRLGLSLPAHATNIRAHDATVFTWCCQLSLDLPDADVERFLGDNPMLPAGDAFTHDANLLQRIADAGKMAPWWDLRSDADARVATAKGRRQRGSKQYAWDVCVAIAAQEGDVARIYVDYTEEAVAQTGAPEQPSSP